MHVVVWIAEDTWEGCVDRARAFVAAEDEVTLLHVSPSDVEAVAQGGAAGLLGRRPPRPPGPPLRVIAAEEAQAILDGARERLGRPAELVSRRGRIEREVLEASAGADLIVFARDGRHRLAPDSLGPRGRFVVDHAPCQVLIVWPDTPPDPSTLDLPPHLR